MPRSLQRRAMSRSERRVLDRKLKDLSVSVRVHQRYRVIEQVSDGRTILETADRVACHFTVSYDWVHRFNESGFATLEQVANPRGRPAILRAEQLRDLVDVALSSPAERGLPFPNWSVPKLAQEAHVGGKGRAPRPVLPRSAASQPTGSRRGCAHILRCGSHCILRCAPGSARPRLDQGCSVCHRQPLRHKRERLPTCRAWHHRELESHESPQLVERTYNERETCRALGLVDGAGATPRATRRTVSSASHRTAPVEAASRPGSRSDWCSRGSRAATSAVRGW